MQQTRDENMELIPQAASSNAVDILILIRRPICEIYVSPLFGRSDIFHGSHGTSDKYC